MDNSIRILHVLSTLDRGGIEAMIMNFYRNIDKKKIQFDFVIHKKEKCDYENEILSLGGKIYRFSKYNGKNHIKYKKEWNNFFENHKEYRIVHSHARSTASIYLRIAKKYERITIAHSHSTASRGNKLEQIIKNIMQFPIRNIADYFFACSNEAGKWLFGENIINNKNYKLIKNAIEVEKYTFNENKRQALRNQMNLTGKFVVGHVGSFTYPKNHKFLIEIFNEIYKKNKNSRLLLVGDGPLKLKIKNQIKNLNLKNKVKFIGVVPNVNDYLQVMDVFVFPSFFEGMPVSLIEAQASGLICLTSDTVTKESEILETSKYISLELKAIYWAEKAIKLYKTNKREDTSLKIKETGYDIKEETKKLEDFYLENWEKI